MAISLAAALPRNGSKKAAFAAAAVMIVALGLTPKSFAQSAAEQKEQIGLLYAVQLAPKICKWTDAGDSSKLDAQVAEAEKTLGITPEEKAKFMAMAEEELRKPGNCDAGGMVRAMYDEAIK